MSFVGLKRERQIRKVLSGLARQRVALVLQPGGVWVIEQALQRDEDVEAALMTCLMRGWIEPLQNDMPTGDLDVANLPAGRPPFTRTETLYRLTEGGWNALNRVHGWTAAGVVLALVTLVLSLTVAA
jgi:hypothetical protein